MGDRVEVKLASGMIVTTDRSPVELVDFQRNAEAKGWRFECPNCGNVASADDFAALGVDRAKAAQECIGRHTTTVDCDWAAYGLLGTMGKGLLVRFPDGKVVEAFAIEGWSDPGGRGVYVERAGEPGD